MIETPSYLRAVLLAITYVATAQAGGDSHDMRAAYERAAQQLPAQASKLVRNVTIDPVWLAGEDKFTYRRQLGNGEKEFVLIDANSNSSAPAFDHVRLAAGLSAASKKRYEPRKLPFDRVALVGKGAEFSVEGKTWRCSLSDYLCAPGANRNPEEILSPDGRWAAFTRENNLFVRSTADQREFALTSDGEQYYAYAAHAGGIASVSDLRTGRKLPPLLSWSPDSRRILTCRTDERNVGSLYLIQSIPDQGWPDGGPRRPLLYSYKYSLPGDENVPRMQLIVFDVESRKRTDLRIPLLIQHGPEHQTLGASLFAGRRAFWSEDSTTAFAAELSRDQKSLRFWSANATTGQAKMLIEDRAPTYVEYDVPAVVLSKRKQILWWSEHSGWGHLYLYDLEGKLVRPVTSGGWVVRSIVGVDEARGEVFVSASGREAGRDPWLQSVYRVQLDTGALTMLSPENADHAVAPLPGPADPFNLRLSPSGNFFIDIYSGIAQAPVSVLRNRDGKVVREIERADVTAYEALKAPSPEEFVVKARDGKTDIYGTLNFPSNFDPKKKYPVLDSDYPGPQAIKAPKRYQAGSIEQATAELGFIVLQVDGLGQPFRSKQYHDYAYGNLGDTGGLEDHIAALKQLVKTHPYLDLDRVGIFGHSGGGFASARAILMFPDFYKVAVASAGNHDQLGYTLGWGEKYQGPVSGRNYDNQDNTLLAKNLKGKLLLAYGDMDDNVNPSLSIRLIDALIKANRDFDVLVMPNRNHTFSIDPYFVRKRWDYFVRNLLGAEPPPNFELKAVMAGPE
jgi:dipeptidyl aminopeptidase/acylaminoacyl peptidase